MTWRNNGMFLGGLGFGHRRPELSFRFLVEVAGCFSDFAGENFEFSRCRHTNWPCYFRSQQEDRQSQNRREDFGPTR